MKNSAGHAPATARRSSGHTLVEITITFGLFMGLIGVFSSSLATSVQQEDLQRDTAEAHRRLDKATDRVRRELERSVWSGAYPQIVDAATLVAHHPDIAGALVGTATDATDSNVLLYLETDDVDGDEWPDQGVEGELLLNANPSAFVLVQDGDGALTLMHVDADRDQRRIARGLTDARFDDAAGTGFTIPLDAIRFRASADRRAANRTLAGAVPLTAEVVVRMER